MLGAIIGDIVGSRFEWNNHRSKDFEFLTYKCFPTDDSIMSLAIAQAILVSRKDHSDLSKNAIECMQNVGRNYPNCGYGRSFYGWIFSDDPKPYNSYGNGAAMRVSAAGFAANSIEEAKNAYEDLINKTDELVKSQFIEMFGDPQTNNKDMPVMHINEVVSLLRNGATIKQNKDKEGYPITRIETISNRTVDRERMGYAGITDISKYEDYVLQDGDILMSHINSVTHMGKSAIYERNIDESIIHGMNLLCLRPKVNIVVPYFLYRYFQLDYFYEQVLSITKKAVNQASMTIKDLGNLTVIVPDIESQMLYVDFVRQSDKSKFALQEAIKDLDALSKKIIAENLIPAGKE